MNTSNNETLLSKAEYLLNQGQPGKTILICRDVLEGSPGNMRALQLNAKALRFSSNLPDAVNLLRSIPAEEMTAESCLELGTCLQKLGQGVEAHSALLRALDMGLETEPVLRRLASVTNMLGKHEEAAEYLECILRQNPDRIIDIYPKLARTLLSAGQAARALEHSNKVLAISPADRFALAYKYIALANIGDVKGARELVNTDDYVKQIELDCPSNFNDISDFNAYLTDHILENTEMDKNPTHYSTRGGWQSEAGSLFENNAALGKTMLEFIRTAQDEYLRLIPADYKQQPIWQGFVGDNLRSIYPWAVVLERQGAQIPHIHPSSWLSGTYYIAVPCTSDSQNPHAGNFVIGRGPDLLQLSVEPKPLMIRPKEGTFCIFPSYYWHGTIPVESNQKRICIAFDWLI